MKFFQYIYIMAFALILGISLSSCEHDDPFPEFQDAVNMRIVLQDGFTTFDATDVPNARILLNLYSQNVEDVEKVDLYVTYYDASMDSTYTEQFVRTILGSSFSNEQLIGVEITSQELAGLYGFDISQVDGGDLFSFRNETTMTDGRVYPDQIEVSEDLTISNTTPNVLNSAATTSFTSSFDVYVACPGSDLGGTYATSTTAASTDPCCPDPVTVDSEVVLAPTSPIDYSVTNFAFGTYSAWYCDPYDLCSATFNGLGATMTDICGQVLHSAGYWGSAGEGSVDEATGVITVNWANGFGDSGTTVMTPQ